MSLQLTFEKLVSYDINKTGITVEVKLQLGETSSVFEAKIDTGSTYCDFERGYGEKLGFDIEAGEKQRIGTVAGSFTAFGHWISSTVENLTFDSMVFLCRR